MARTIPLAPFLPGRGKIEISGGHPQTPAKGLRPLDSRLWTPATAPTPSLRGVKRRGNLMARTIPLAPFLPGRGKIEISGGHPQTPAKGLRPLDSRYCSHPVIARSEATWQSDGSDHPPSPLPGRKGENRDLWGTPPDPCQRAAPSGLPPLDSRYCSHPVIARSEATWQSGEGCPCAMVGWQRRPRCRLGCPQLSRSDR